MQVIIILLHMVVLFLVVNRFYYKFRDSALAPYFLPALLLKLLAGIMVGLIYKYYYNGGDTFSYFHDAVSFSELFFRSPLLYAKALWGVYPEGWGENLIYFQQERALLTSRLLSFFTLISHNNYWIAGLYFSLLSFLGMFYLAKEITRFTRVKEIIPVGAFLFFPSVVFWSSGVLKEPIIMCCLCLILAIYIPYLLGGKKIPFWKMLLTVLLGWLLWKIKYYYAAVLFPLLFAGLFTTYLKSRVPFLKKSGLWQAATALGVFLLLLITASLLHPNLHFSSVLQAVTRNHDLYLPLAGSDNLIHFKDLEPTWDSFLKNAPLAIFSGLFSPTFFEAGNPFQYYVAFENLLLFLFFLLGLYGLKKGVSYSHPLPLLLMVIYILMLATVLPLASPNFGTLARHKIGFLPFFIYLILAANPFLARLKQAANLSGQGS